MSDEKHASPKTFDALNLRNLAAKREYVRGLEQRRDPEAISLLVECLCDESWYLRGLAEQAFLGMGTERADVLLPLLEQGLWYTRASAAGVLGRLGYGPAVPGLLRLAEDPVRTVAEAAREALIAIGRSGGAARLAHVLHRLAPDLRRRRLEEIAARDAALVERVRRLMANEELMGTEDERLLSDDHPMVRASEDGYEWEVLTGSAATLRDAAAATEPQGPPRGPGEPPGRREDEPGTSA